MYAGFWVRSLAKTLDVVMLLWISVTLVFATGRGINLFAVTGLPLCIVLLMWTIIPVIPVLSGFYSIFVFYAVLMFAMGRGSPLVEATGLHTSTVIPICLSICAISAFYFIFFVGRFGGTPGKLAIGLRVVTAGRENLSYGRATRRFFAEMISGLTFLTGYLMAATDSQKRSLHDRICNTRVIRPTGESESEQGLRKAENGSKKIFFLDHMNQLPRRLGHIVIYVCVGFIACFFLAHPIYQFISIPFIKSLHQGTKIVYINPTDPRTIYLKVAFVAGIFLTAPFSVFEIWKLIAPPLYSKEKKYFFPFMFASVVLILLGGALCYYVGLPQTYGSLIGVGVDFQPIVEYLDQTLMMLLGFALIFQMPVIVAFLSIFRLASAKGSPGLRGRTGRTGGD